MAAATITPTSTTTALADDFLYCDQYSSRLQHHESVTSLSSQTTATTTTMAKMATTTANNVTMLATDTAVMLAINCEHSG